MATAEEIYGKDLAHKGDFVKTASGDLDTISGLQNLKESLFRRLITQPGSIIHRPNYGVGIKDFQNSIGSIASHRKLASRIQEQYEQDPRVEKVKSVSVLAGDRTPDKVEIRVSVKPVGYDEVQFKFIPFGDY